MTPPEAPIRRLLPLALLGSLAPAPAAALSLSDAFDGGSLDPFYWQVAAPTGTTVDASTGRLVVTQMGGTGVTSITLVHPIAGDFSATVDYELLSWPTDNGELLGFGTLEYGAAERVSRASNGGEVYLSDLRGGGGEVSPSIVTTDTSGTLRMTRTGTQVCASYFDGMAFQDLQCLTDAAPADATFVLGLWRDSDGGDGIQVAFDDFALEAPSAHICGDGVEEGPEACDDGNTTVGDGCDTSCQDEGASPCAVAPIPACAAAGKASLSVVESKPGKEKLKLALKKLASAVTLADLGDPVSSTTRYDVCLYDAASQLAGVLTVDRAGQTCGAKPCWKAVGSVGFKYKDPAAAASGVRSLQLKSGDAGKGGLSLQAGNQSAKAQTALPTGIAAALQGATSATVQVLTDVPSCFQAELGTVKKADGTRFQAAAP
jgi:cysteine-rich repeat protein